MAKISVITTVYNTAEYIKKCIDSVLNQSFKDYELIIIDDCSTDNSLEIVNSYDDSRIKVICNEYNLGAGKSRQVGIDNAIGNFTYFLDSDDFIEPDCLLNLYNATLLNSFDIVSCGIKINNITDELIKEMIFPYHLGGKLIRRTLWNKVKYCTLSYYEDSPTFFRLKLFTNKIGSISYEGHNYTIREGSLTRTSTSLKTSIYRLLSVIDNIKFLESINYDYKLIESLKRDLKLKYMLFSFNRKKTKDTNLYKEELDTVESFCKSI